MTKKVLNGLALGPTTLYSRGLYSARPAATADNAGALYFATDDPVAGTGTLYISTGSGWDLVSASTVLEIARAELTASSGNLTATADVTGLSITFTLATARTVKLLFDGYCTNDTAGKYGVFAITDGSNNEVTECAWPELSTASANLRCHAERVLSLAAGTYTYKVRGGNGGTSGNAKVIAASYVPAFIEATVL